MLECPNSMSFSLFVVSGWLTHPFGDRVAWSAARSHSVGHEWLTRYKENNDFESRRGTMLTHEDVGARRAAMPNRIRI